MNGDALREMTVAEILSAAFALYREHFAALVMLALLPHLVLLGLDLMIVGASEAPAMGLGILLGATVVLNALVLAAVTHTVAGALAGRMPGLGEAYRLAFSQAIAAIVFAYLVVWMLVTLGFLAFIIPGLLIGGLLMPTVPIIVVERLGPISALVRAYRMMRPALMTGAAVFAFVIAVTGLLPLMVHVLVGPGPFSPLLGAILGAVTLPLAYSATVILYLSMRSREGYTLDALRAELGLQPAGAAAGDGEEPPAHGEP